MVPTPSDSMEKINQRFPCFIYFRILYSRPADGFRHRQGVFAGLQFNGLTGGKIVQTGHILFHIAVLFHACTVTGVIFRIIAAELFR